MQLVSSVSEQESLLESGAEQAPMRVSAPGEKVRREQFVAKC
jgi:hypothetical protein